MLQNKLDLMVGPICNAHTEIDLALPTNNHFNHFQQFYLVSFRSIVRFRCREMVIHHDRKQWSLFRLFICLFVVRHSRAVCRISNSASLRIEFLCSYASFHFARSPYSISSFIWFRFVSKSVSIFCVTTISSRILLYSLWRLLIRLFSAFSRPTRDRLKFFSSLFQIFMPTMNGVTVFTQFEWNTHTYIYLRLESIASIDVMVNM